MDKAIIRFIPHKHKGIFLTEIAVWACTTLNSLIEALLTAPIQHGDLLLRSCWRIYFKKKTNPTTRTSLAARAVVIFHVLCPLEVVQSYVD